MRNENVGAAGREARCCDTGADGGGVSRTSRSGGPAIEPKGCSGTAYAGVTAIGVGGVSVALSGTAGTSAGAAATLGIPLGGVGATTRGERSLRPQS